MDWWCLDKNLKILERPTCVINWYCVHKSKIINILNVHKVIEMLQPVSRQVKS